MALVAANVQLKARLLTKGKLRPHDMVRNKLPDGAGLLEELPRRARSGADEGDEAADAAYCAAIDKVSRVFGKQRRAQSTADEHKMYMRLLDGWFVREGFGSYVEAVIVDGRCIEVRARRRDDGTMKVLKPQMLIGHLLEMSVGSESTPKGGHAADLAARAATEVANACGPREKMRCARARGSWNPRPARAARGRTAAALVPVRWVRRATCSRVACGVPCALALGLERASRLERVDAGW